MKRFINKLFVATITSAMVFSSLTGIVLADNGANPSSSIVIDGLYDDWNNVPVQEITYTGYNGTDIHVGQIYTDGEYMYVHFKVSDLYSSEMPLGQFYLTVNGVTQEMHIFPDNNFWGSVNQGNPGSFNNLSVGVRGQATNWQPTTLAGECILNCYNAPWYSGNDKKGSEFEFKVKLEDVANAYGTHPESMGTITITNTSLGTEGVSIAGTPTGPIIGVAIGSIIAMGGAYVALKRKNTETLEKS
ncbi:MAG: Firmicu-CTERM sorting domain-containing protein [Saccharofermentans sp.]|nr:Firmicu-CTERM sorting domain-containing protein [Saccharofermentans sp.]